MTPDFHHPEFIKQAYVDAHRMRHRMRSEMLQARIFLQAQCPINDIKRFFHIFTYPTLAEGIWAIKVINGRIGCKGVMRHYHFDDPQELQTKLRLLLRKRLNATRRLGCDYRIIDTTLLHHTINELVAPKTKPARRKKDKLHDVKQVKVKAQSNTSVDLKPSTSIKASHTQTTIVPTPSLIAQLQRIQNTTKDEQSALRFSSTPKPTPQVTNTAILPQFVPSSSQAYLWQSCVPTKSVPETRLKRENDPERRRQKLQDTLNALNKKMGKDTVVVATSPLKSHWMTK